MTEALVSEMVDVSAAGSVADAFVTRPDDGGSHPGVVLYMDAFGIRAALERHAERLASHGYVVLVPNVFYRAVVLRWSRTSSSWWEARIASRCSP